MIKHIQNVEEFDSVIKQGEVLVDFYADWCGPCKMLAPVLEELSREVEITIAKVNVDELGVLAQRYKIQAIPSLFYLQDGVIKNNALGYKNKNELLKFIGK